uniref:Uncharacterized protein n=1 Tax=Trichogramma kaykai TaxID=54128 RepID=A0ABD2WZF8_9HYME
MFRSSANKNDTVTDDESDTRSDAATPEVIVTTRYLDNCSEEERIALLNRYFPGQINPKPQSPIIDNRADATGASSHEQYNENNEDRPGNDLPPFNSPANPNDGALTHDNLPPPPNSPIHPRHPFPYYPYHPMPYWNTVNNNTQPRPDDGNVPYVPARSQLSDAIKNIPKFDGRPERLPLFCQAVQRAVTAFPRSELDIIQSLESKLIGEAEVYVGLLISYPSADTLLADLKDRFGNRGIAESLSLQLGTARQEKDESARDFGSRVQLLYNRIRITYSMAPDIDAIDRESSLRAIERNIISCFLYGLREPLQNLVRHKVPITLQEAIRRAVDIERELTIRSTTGACFAMPGLPIIPRISQQIAPSALSPQTSEVIATRNSDTKEKVRCQYCQKANHTAKECWILERELRGNSNNNNNSAPSTNSNNGSDNKADSSNGESNNKSNNGSNNNNNRNNYRNNHHRYNNRPRNDGGNDNRRGGGNDRSQSQNNDKQSADQKKDSSRDNQAQASAPHDNPQPKN